MFVSPLLLIIGLVVMRTSHVERKNQSQSLAVTPSLYITPAGSQDYASRVFIQNSTKHGLEGILSMFDKYQVGYEKVHSITSVLDTSKHDLANLGFDIRDFPANMVIKIFNLCELNTNITEAVLE